MDNIEFLAEVENTFYDLGMTPEEENRELPAAIFRARNIGFLDNEDRWLKDKPADFYRGMMAAMRVMISAQIHLVPDHQELKSFTVQFNHEIGYTLLTVLNKDNGKS